MSSENIHTITSHDTNKLTLFNKQNVSFTSFSVHSNKHKKIRTHSINFELESTIKNRPNHQRYQHHGFSTFPWHRKQQHKSNDSLENTEQHSLSKTITQKEQSTSELSKSISKQTATFASVFDLTECNQVSKSIIDDNNSTEPTTQTASTFNINNDKHHDHTKSSEILEPQVQSTDACDDEQSNTAHNSLTNEDSQVKTVVQFPDITIEHLTMKDEDNETNTIGTIGLSTRFSSIEKMTDKNEQVENNLDESYSNATNYPFRSAILSPSVEENLTIAHPIEKKKKLNLIKQVYHSIHPLPRRLHHPASSSTILTPSISRPVVVSFQDENPTNHKKGPSWLKRISKLNRPFFHALDNREKDNTLD
ncbi:unnamed protein product [Didymodactylos carnosus]|uniref:Uncharacterized protein n=1 Tax=Didymodactylos carnosus TaxID=1234261 RepID=A0A815AV05_9BILA|nr:unnamed protein product [Didymodactylos carnosus]CAF4046216.1 unnamed protein product [Didymodactylos carnosus]